MAQEKGPGHRPLLLSHIPVHPDQEIYAQSQLPIPSAVV